MKQGLKTSAFTLIELLIVITIIAILAAIIIPKISDATGKAKRVACSSNMQNIVKAMQLYEEDRGVSVVSLTDTASTTVFGRLNYIETSKEGDQKLGITTMKIYNCPESKSTPPTATTYKEPLTVTTSQNIDYGFVLTGNLFQYKKDPDRNVVLIEIGQNHAKGRNVAFWDSSVTFIPLGTNYPLNSDAATGAQNTTPITNPNQVIGTSAVITAALPT